MSLASMLRTPARAAVTIGATCCVAVTNNGLLAQGAARTAAGTLFFTRGEQSHPLAGAWVTLHRVGRDSAGPVDSMKTVAGGAFRFLYRPWGDTGAVYFVSSRYAGIAYFSSGITARTTAPGDADLNVYDTTSLRVPIDVASRHIIVSAPDTSATRQVVEVYVLLNGTGLTRVAGQASAATFETKLPAGATAPRGVEGDVPAQAMSFVNGRMTITAPIAPGTKRFSYSYRLAASASELAFPSLSSIDVLEVMVEDSAGTVSGPSMHEEAPVVVSGRSFRRYIGHDVAQAAVTRVRTAGGPAFGIDAIRALVVIAAAAAMIVALIRAMRAGPSPNAGVALAPPGRAD